MSTPADNSSYCKQRGVQCIRYLEHLVEQTTVVVNVDADTLVDLALLGDDFRSDSLYEFIKFEFVLLMLFFGKFFHIFLYDDGSRV